MQMIDIFNHFMPKPYLDALAELVPGHIAVTAFPRLKTIWDVEARLALLDRFPGLQQVICLANPPLELIAAPNKTPDIAKLANDGLADVVARHPDRFPAFIASLPMNNVDASLAEIDRSVAMGARGIQIFTNVAGEPLSLPKYRPIFARMGDHDLPVWVHPMRTAQFPDYASEQASEAEVWFTFGWPYETTACMTRLIYSGIFDELPGLKIVTHHYGGMIPFFAGRIDLGFRQIFFGTPGGNPCAEHLKLPPRDYYNMLFADTALNGEIAATRCGHDFFGTTQSLFATDAPFDSQQGAQLIGNTIAAVNALEISDADRAAIFAGNAKKLLRL